jgi:hypothetical protein
MTPKQKAQANIKAFLKELDAKYDWTYDVRSDLPIPLIMPPRKPKVRFADEAAKLRTWEVRKAQSHYASTLGMAHLTRPPSYLRGRKRTWMAGKLPVPVFCAETGERYPSMLHLARGIGISKGWASKAVSMGWRIRGKLWRKAA